MSFIKLSILWNYLYSPVSWLHQCKKTTKIILVFLCLIYLPYAPIQQIYYCFTILFLIYTSIYIPLQVIYYFSKMLIFCILVTLINIQNKIQALNLIRKYLYFYNPISLLLQLNTGSVNNNITFSLYYYLPLPLVRLLTINFLYLMLMKILFLTTLYENILDFFFNSINKYKNLVIKKVLFEIQVSIQFLKTILKIVEKIRIGYAIRSVQLYKTDPFHKAILIYYFCIQQLITNIYISIYNIANTMYNSGIHIKNLNITYNQSPK